MGGSWKSKRFFSTELIYIFNSSVWAVSRIGSETFHNFNIKSFALSQIVLLKKNANVKFKFVQIPFRYTYQGLIALSRQSRRIERYVSQPRI